MPLDLLTETVDRGPTRLAALQPVPPGAEYLRDHFPEFPLLPGVLMLEGLVQAAARLAGDPPAGSAWVLAQVRALRFGRIARPGDVILVEVERLKPGPSSAAEFRGQSSLVGAGDGSVVCSGRFSLRPTGPWAADGMEKAGVAGSRRGAGDIIASSAGGPPGGDPS